MNPTAVNAFHLFWKTAYNVGGLREDMVSNAKAWRLSAQGPTIGSVANDMGNAANSYLMRIATFDRTKNDPLWPSAESMLRSLGGQTETFDAAVEPLRAAANALLSAPKTSNAEIVQACDAVISALTIEL